MVPVDPTAKPSGGPESPAAVVAAVRAVNKSEMLGDNRQLLFTRDQDTQAPVIQILSRSTGEVIEQIPPERVLRMMAELRAGQKGGNKR